MREKESEYTLKRESSLLQSAERAPVHIPALKYKGMKAYISREEMWAAHVIGHHMHCLLYTSPSPRD